MPTLSLSPMAERNASKSTGNVAGKGKQDQDGHGLFSTDITDEEMKAWGTDGADLPCLSDVTSGPPQLDSP